MDVSASFVCVMLAAAYLGPAEAFAVVVFSESVAWLSQRYRPQALVVNLAAIGIPALIAGTLMDALVTDATSRVEFLAVLAAAAVINLTVNFVLACSLLALMDGLSLRQVLRPPAQLLPALGLTVALTLAVAEVYERFGVGASALVLLLIVAFTYMARLVVTARERTAQYASLSWGVLSGLIRTLDRRDGRAARHAAAVAAFARDIAARGRDVAPRPGARAHRGAAARHRQVRAVRPRPRARRRAARGRLGRDPPPPRARRRPAARPRRLRPGRRDRPRAPRADGRARLPGRPGRRRDPGDREDRRGRRGLRHADAPRTPTGRR